MKRKVKKSVIKLVLRVVSICILSYFSFTLINYTGRIKNLKTEENSLSNKLMDLKTEEEYLKTQILKLNDKEYIARYAREHFLYSKDGEYVIRIEQKENKKEEIKKEENSKIPFIIAITSFIIIITIFMKKKTKRK